MNDFLNSRLGRFSFSVLCIGMGLALAGVGAFYATNARINYLEATGPMYQEEPAEQIPEESHDEGLLMKNKHGSLTFVQLDSATVREIYKVIKG